MIEIFAVRKVFLVGFSILILNWVWRAVNWVWLRPKRLEKYLKKQGFSGNSYRILMGDMRESNQMDKVAHSLPLPLTADFLPRMMPFLHHTVLNHGKKCFTWYGPYPNVIVMDPETLREIMSRHELFPKPKIGSHNHVFLSGLLNHEGPNWSKHRSILNPAFRIENLKSILPAFSSSCKEMLEEWEKLASAKGTVELDSWTYCHDLTRNMLARASFGDSYNDGIKIFEVQQEQIDLGLQAIRSVYIPGSKFLPTKFNKRLRETERDMRSMFKDMIEAKEKEIKRGRHADKNSDLLFSMLASNTKQIKEHGPDSGLSLDDLIDDCKAFYLAGQNVTSSLFVWTLVALSQHQEWQNKARDEISQAFDNNEPDFEGLSHLKVVSMILHEVLRLYSPAYFTCRVTKQEVKLEKFSLPEGVVVTIPMLLVHHDPDLWGDDVKQFKPERFVNGVASATKGRLSFLPFSSGPRTCIGQNFSMLQAKLFVAKVLQRFSVELSPSYTHAPFPAATTFPQHGAHLIIRKI
ncbi:Cytochrome P450 72C1 [Hirschfeldia incana]|nr:Cytochrome P450 72C1 [Hirschfeldia incana]